MSDTLPPLPPKVEVSRHIPTGIVIYGYTAAQMREYAAAALAAAVAEPVAFRCWHPIARRAFYLSTEPPAPTRYDTGEADEYFGGKVEPLYAAPPQREPQWVPVAERLPEKFTEVLVAFSGQMSIASTGQYTNSPHDTNGWCYPAENNGICDDGSDPVVTHWMPLPDAPASAPKEQP